MRFMSEMCGFHDCALFVVMVAEGSGWVRGRECGGRGSIYILYI